VTCAGTPSHEDPNIDRVLEAGDELRQRRDDADALDLERLVATTASGRMRLARIISVCSAASWVVTSTSPDTVATTAGCRRRR